MGADQNPFGRPDGGSALPRPADWTRQRLPVWLKVSMGLVALIALGMAAEAAWSFWTGQPATGVPLAAGAIYLGHVVGLSARVWRTRRRSSKTSTLTAAPDATRGVTFTYSAWSYHWVTAVLMMTELVALAVTAGFALSATAVGVAMAVAIGVLAMIVGWGVVTMLRLAPGKIVLSPTGVYHRGLTSTHFVPWSAIVAVFAAWVGTPIIAVKAFPSRDTRVRRSMGRFGSGEAHSAAHGHPHRLARHRPDHRLPCPILLPHPPGSTGRAGHTFRPRPDQQRPSSRTVHSSRRDPSLRVTWH